MSDLTAADVIRILALQPHPEGGHYRETFRDQRGEGTRAASTAIYFLLAAGEVSRWHRVDAAEVWHWYAGAPLALSIAPPDGNAADIRLGADLAAGERPQGVVPPGYWQAPSPGRLDAGRLHRGAGLRVRTIRNGRRRIFSAAPLRCCRAFDLRCCA